MWSSRKAQTVAGETRGAASARSAATSQPTAAHVRGERQPGVAAPQRVEPVVGEGAEGEARADEGDAEPDALLPPRGEGGQVAARHEARVEQCGLDHEPGDGAGEAVVVPAGRHRIHVRAGEDGGRGPVAAGQRAVEVARAVPVDLQPERAGGLGEALGGEPVLLAPGRAGHARVHRAGGADLVEERRCQRQPRLHRLPQPLPLRGLHGAKTSMISS